MQKLLLLSLVCSISFSQLMAFSQQPVIKNLVFEGAGIRGLAYAGAVEALEEDGQLEFIEKIGGTSAGAITALLLGSGYTADEMATIIAGTKFRKFNDGRFIFIGGFIRLFKRYGWYRGERFKRWLEQLILHKGINPEITFKEWHESGRPDLYIVTTCLNRQKLLVLSHETYPEMKVVDAVRASMSIPLYYQAVFTDSLGNTYKKQNKDHSLDILVDGGIIGNYPIMIFDSIQLNSNGLEYRVPNQHTLGFRMDEPTQIQNDSNDQKLAAYPIASFKDYMAAFYVIVIETLNRQTLNNADWERTVSISSEGISPKVKKLSKEEKQLLLDSGRKYVQQFFDER